MGPQSIADFEYRQNAGATTKVSILVRIRTQLKTAKGYFLCGVNNIRSWTWRFIQVQLLEDWPKKGVWVIEMTHLYSAAGSFGLLRPNNTFKIWPKVHIIGFVLRNGHSKIGQTCFSKTRRPQTAGPFYSFYSIGCATIVLRGKSSSKKSLLGTKKPFIYCSQNFQFLHKCL